MSGRRTVPGIREAAGFTLLEIMVAMLLLAVIVTSSVSLLFINIRGWDALVGDSEQALDQTLINNRIAITLRHLSPLVWQSEGKKRLAFSGEPNRVHFISRAPQQYRAGGWFEYLLTQEIDSENRLGLVLYYAPYLPGSTEFLLPDAGQRRELFADTGSVTFSYLGTKERGGKHEWWDRWEAEMSGYPEMIQMQFAGHQDLDDASTRFIRLLTDSPRDTP